MSLTAIEMKKIRDVSLNALREIYSLIEITDNWSDPVAKKLYKGIGIVVGTIDFRILDVIYDEYPDWNDNSIDREARNNNSKSD